ncbi:MAG: guanylate kinase [Syntrophobacterales bacterium]|nr:guanylate kinase [Syntrophobacterales bacterium]
MEGSILVISAPSGAGKSTLIQRLLAADPRLRFSISYTTRPPRPGEVHGKDYHFISHEDFLRLRDSGGLVEWVEQFGYFYGTGVEWVRRTIAGGADALLDLEPRGARAIKALFPAALLIFILPPSLEELERRLRLRGGLSLRELAQRLEQGREELRQACHYDYLVVNEDLATAETELKAIITAARLRSSISWPHLAPRFQV